MTEKPPLHPLKMTASAPLGTPPSPPQPVVLQETSTVEIGPMPTGPAPAPKSPRASVQDVSPDEVRKRLKTYVDRIFERHTYIEEIFKDKPITPLKNDEYQRFLTDHFAEIAMRFVTMGRFQLPGDEPGSAPGAAVDPSVQKAEALRAQGFTTSDDAAEAGAGTASGATIDEALEAHPAMQLARLQGFDPDKDED